jgi:hypothetical protein
MSGWFCYLLYVDHVISRNLKARPHYSCSYYSLYTLRGNIRILTRRSLASNWSSVDEDLRAQVKARRVSRRAQPGQAPARARVMWTHLNCLRRTAWVTSHLMYVCNEDVTRCFLNGYTSTWKWMLWGAKLQFIIITPNSNLLRFIAENYAYMLTKRRYWQHSSFEVSKYAVVRIT